MSRPANPELPNRILAAAEEIVAVEGHHSLNMRELAKKVGITATTIYNYFKDRNDLLLKLEVQIAEKLNDRIRHIDPTLDPAQYLYEFGVIYLDFAKENPRLYRLYMESEVCVDEHGCIIRTDKDYRQLYFPYYAARNTLERHAGKYTPEVGATLGWVLLHGFASLMSSGRLQPAEGQTLEELREQFFRFYITL